MKFLFDDYFKEQDFFSAEVEKQAMSQLERDDELKEILVDGEVPHKIWVNTTTIGEHTGEPLQRTEQTFKRLDTFA